MAIPVRSLRLLPQSQDKLNNLTGSRGEIFYDRDANNIRIFDGTSTGGRLVGRTEEQTQDLVAAMFAGSSSNVSVAYDDLTGKLVLTADVSAEFSGDYDDLTNKPTSFTGLSSLSMAVGPVISEISLDGTLSDNSDAAVPTEQAVKTYVDTQLSTVDPGELATVATSGDYDDLTNKPTLFSGSWVDLTEVPNFYDAATFTGLTTLQQTAEVLNTINAATGVVTHDFSTGAVWYHTNISANFTANFTNVPTSANRAISVVLVLAQGAVPFVPNSVQIDGTVQTVRLLNDAALVGTANKVDTVSFTLIRTDSSWTVLGSLSTYG